MRIEQLNYFIETARQQSIHKASDKLHMSHQSLNASLKSLETELGHALLVRSPQGVMLTPAGELLLQYALEVSGRTRQLQSALDALLPSAAPAVTGSLNCIVSPHLAVQILPQLIKTFTQAYPQITLNIKERDSMQIAQRFEQGYEGLALFTHYENSPDTLPQSDTLIIQRLFDEVDYAAVALTHPLAAYKSISLKTLLNYPLALYQNGDDDTCLPLEVLKKFGTPQLYMLSDNVSVLEDAAISGHAVTLAPLRALKHHVVFTKPHQVAILKIRDYPHILISSIVSHTYYQTHQPLIDLFVDTFKRIW